MPNHRTFEIKPIANLLIEELDNDWKDTTIDPFPYPFKEDAIAFLKRIPTNSQSKAVFDGPYSQRQLLEMYKGIGLSYDVNSGYWAKCRNELARILKKDGKCISFGWNSTGLTRERGFEITRILIVAHGGQHNDTIVTVDKKIQ